jgi:hypothetical protein
MASQVRCRSVLDVRDARQKDGAAHAGRLPSMSIIGGLRRIAMCSEIRNVRTFSGAGLLLENGQARRADVHLHSQNLAAYSLAAIP